MHLVYFQLTKPTTCKQLHASKYLYLLLVNIIVLGFHCWWEWM